MREQQVAGERKGRIDWEERVVTAVALVTLAVAALFLLRTEDTAAAKRHLLSAAIFGFAIYVLVILLLKRFRRSLQEANAARLAAQEAALAAQHDQECRVFYEELSELKDCLNDSLGEMQEMLAKQEYAELSRYFDTFGGRIQTPRLILSGNEAFDIVLNQKISWADSLAIHIQLDVQNIPLYHVSDVDVVRLFSNILDNAIEAAQREHADKIWFSVHRKGNYVIIEEENPCSELRLGKKGELRTRKRNPAEHGMGMKIIRSLAEKYGGSCTATLREGNFYIKVILEDRA